MFLFTLQDTVYLLTIGAARTASFLATELGSFPHLQVSVRPVMK